MQNKLSCNLQTIALLVLICRSRKLNLANTLEYLYPKSVIDLDGKEHWANCWKDKIILSKMSYNELANDPNLVVVGALDDTEWVNYMTNKINSLLNY